MNGGFFMELSGVQLIAIFIVSAIAGMGSVLDEFQTHRPLIACTLVGAILGDMTTGIIIGGTLEMIALGWMNIGAAMAPDAALASVISTILVIAGHQSIGAGIAIAMPLAAAGQVLTIICRTITVFFQHKADGFAQEGNLRGIDICHLGALLLQALRVAVPSLLVAKQRTSGSNFSPAEYHILNTKSASSHKTHGFITAPCSCDSVGTMIGFCW